MTAKVVRHDPDSPDVTFARPPTDFELATYFPGRPRSSELSRRVDGDRELWEIPRITYWQMALAFCSTLPAVGLAWWMMGLDTRWFPRLAVATALCLGGTFGMLAYLNRLASKINPILMLDHGRGELHISGRDEPIRTADVVEIICWELSPENLFDLGLDREEVDVQVSALIRRGESWQQLFLYHDDERDAERGDDAPARRLAQSLQVPLRRVTDVAAIRDLRKPDHSGKEKA
jgi:hypothetical protein